MTQFVDNGAGIFVPEVKKPAKRFGHQLDGSYILCPAVYRVLVDLMALRMGGPMSPADDSMCELADALHEHQDADFPVNT